MHAPGLLQPALTKRIAAAIEDTDPDSGLTHRELAQVGYGVEEPSDAQLSAVRRSVARLARDGRAERGRRRHLYSGGRSPVEIHRPLTPAEHEVKAQRGEAAIRWLTERREAEANAINYPVDTGYGGVVEVQVEPVLRITENGVELRESQEVGA